jgi:hypothetical protein
LPDDVDRLATRSGRGGVRARVHRGTAATTGIPTGNGAQGAYMVASGTHVNAGCRFDYGNAETNNNDTGNGHMEAIYLRKLRWFTPCNGSGPSVIADLENGLFSGGWADSNNTGVPFDCVTAVVKGHSAG